MSAWGAWPGDSSSLIGSRWRLELFSDSGWTTGVFDSGTLDFFAFTCSAFGVAAYGLEPYGVEPTDHTARLAPMLVFFAAVAVGSFRITITNGGAVDTPYFEARRIWLADAVAAPYNARYGASPAWIPYSKHRRTIGGSLHRLRRDSRRALSFDTVFTSEADRAAWNDLMYVCDPANEIVICLFPTTAAPRKLRDFTVMGSLEVLNPIPFENVNIHRLKIAIVES
ncbi:MAG: hypothetical protein IPM64_17590 [Phycisphaerales bacterium]|nr:hypothetical protein [Phycisphaerales bacterium]